jgi:DNA-directed RNA polymerase specialized sigma subunit
MKYPREYFWFVERILREYPQNVEELVRLEETIEADCRAPSLPAIGHRTPEYSEPERVTMAKLGNRNYVWLKERIKTVNQGMVILKKSERKVIRLFYFENLRNREIVEEMHITERWVKRLKILAVEKLFKTFIATWVK